MRSIAASIFVGKIFGLSFLQTTQLILVLVCFCLFGSPIAELSILIAFFIVLRIIVLKEIHGYILLSVLFLISDGVRNFVATAAKVNLYGEVASNWQPISKLLWIDSMVNFITVNSVEVTIQLIAGLGILTLFIFRLSFHSFFQITLLAIVVICSVSSYLAYTLGYNGYSTSLYIAFSLLAINWGYSLRGIGNEMWIDVLFEFVFWGILACAIGLIQGHMIFLLVGLAGGMTCYYFLVRRLARGLISLAAAIFIIANTTYTLFAMYVISLVLSFFIVYQRRTLSPSLKNLSFALSGLAMFASLYVAIDSEVMTLSVADNMFFQNAFNKFAFDRAPVWKGAYELVITTNSAVAPANRPYIINYNDVVMEWPVGAHNIFLEAFRQIGWAGGLIISAVLLFVMYRMFSILALNRSYRSKLLAIGLISIFFTYGFTGHYLLTGGVGIVFGGLVGVLLRQMEYVSKMAKVPGPVNKGLLKLSLH